jgi:lysyl-tRNA synthetase class 2
LRSRQIQKLRQTQDPDPYPHKFEVTQSITSYIDEFGRPGIVENGASLADKIVSNGNAFNSPTIDAIRV